MVEHGAECWAHEEAVRALMAETFLPPVQESSSMQKPIDFCSVLWILAWHQVAICLIACMNRYREAE
jgi:hypothetical protein